MQHKINLSKKLATVAQLWSPSPSLSSTDTT